MLGLVEPDGTGAGDLELRGEPKPGFGDRLGEDNAFLFQLPTSRGQVVAHQPELMLLGARRGRMHRNLGGRRFENEPAFTSVDVLPAEHVPEEGARPHGILSEEDRMRSGDHAASITIRQDRSSVGSVGIRVAREREDAGPALTRLPRISLRCTDLLPIPAARQLGLAADSDRPQAEAAKARSGSDEFALLQSLQRSSRPRNKFV